MSIAGAIGTQVKNAYKRRQEKGGSSSVSGPEPLPMDFHKGGVVPKTGMAKVHKGERVLTKKQAKSYRKGRGK